MTGKRKGLRILGTVACILLTVLVLLRVLALHRSRPEEIRRFETSNPYISDVPLILAHRIGAGEMPEESRMALERLLLEEDGPDMIEFDLHMTGDGIPVLLHDDDLDRTSDAPRVFGRKKSRPEEHTYEELRGLNMGAEFVDSEGRKPFAWLQGDEVPDGLRMLSLDQALELLEANGKKRCLVEIKNRTDAGCRCVDILAGMIRERGLEEKAMVASFSRDIMAYTAKNHPELTLAASTPEGVEFVWACLTGRKEFSPPYRALALPFDLSGFVNLGQAQIINYAHEHNLAVFYWTVNDEKDLAYLMSIGADGVITDYPERAYRVRSRILSEKEGTIWKEN